MWTNKTASSKSHLCYHLFCHITKKVPDDFDTPATETKHTSRQTKNNPDPEMAIQHKFVQCAGHVKFKMTKAYKICCSLFTLNTRSSKCAPTQAQQQCDKLIRVKDERKARTEKEKRKVHEREAWELRKESKPAIATHLTSEPGKINNNIFVRLSKCYPPPTSHKQQNTTTKLKIEKFSCNHPSNKRSKLFQSLFWSHFNVGREWMCMIILEKCHTHRHINSSFWQNQKKS